MDFFLSEYPEDLRLDDILQSLYDNEPIEGIVEAETYQDWYSPFLAERIAELVDLQKRLVKELNEQPE